MDTEDKLRTIFSIVGQVNEVKLVKDDEGKSKRQAIITYADQTMAESVCNLLNGYRV